MQDMINQPARHSEAAFETTIETHLRDHGYAPLTSGYDRTRAIFPAITIAFIQQTQPKTWHKLETLHGTHTTTRVLDDLGSWMNTYGALHTLRHGFKCYGHTLRIAFFKAAHDLNADLTAHYAANHLGITRQLQYSERHPKRSLDLTISLNGIPVITLELKNPLTGQTVADARQQYRADRDPHEPLFAFNRRTLVHFAVDTEEAWMTTRLAGEATHFLPFNRGNHGGAGNPPDPQGRSYRTAYLWETILQRDSLLDILARFLHLQTDHKQDETGRTFKKESLIFPRYHQLHAVRTLIDAARSEGVGHNYLIEHSAGSGKSNTIGWLAHQLAQLHNAHNQRIFDSVVVITDRRVLDQQLQDTIYQFDHRQGVVQKIDEQTRQLAQALEQAVPIIITTLQKFPYLAQQLQKLAEQRQETDTLSAKGLLPTRHVAVIVDEAHSSQSGDTATNVRGALGGERLNTIAQQRAHEEEQTEWSDLFHSMAKRAQQENISFFAFTATPKHTTLAMFGRDGQPFHRYTMRQAIEEGFIMDVLRHYTTYTVYYNLLKKSVEDQHVERKHAAKALARFARLHPHNIAQKTEVMIEHFFTFTRHKIGGRAKAMVVTDSRLAAVRYKQSFDAYIAHKKYPIKTLVAFSGTVIDDRLPTKTYSEAQMNDGIYDREIPERFASSDYHILLVAEKYQTGFDQPLLHTMYIDKRLAGIQAVQTLSRLNRIHPLKEDTFVLDFVNSQDEIKDAFKQYYEGSTMGQAADPAQLYRLKHELDATGVYRHDDVARFSAIYFQPKQRQSTADHQAMNAALDPTVERFRALAHQHPDEAELWRKKIVDFRDLYAFLSQIMPYQDSDLERLYIFLRHLATKLPRRDTPAHYDVDSDVRLEYYRLQKVSEGAIDLTRGYTQPLDGPTDVGSGILRESRIALSHLIDLINARFGTDFNQADQLFFDQIVEAAAHSAALHQAAQVNTPDTFTLLFNRLLETFFIERMDQNELLFARYMNDRDFQKAIAEWIGGEVYQRLTTGSAAARTDR